MKKILFVTQDLAVGGGTSSLSCLYDYIKNDYDIQVKVLSREGSAMVSYSKCILPFDSILNLYLGTLKISHGFRRIGVAIFRIIDRLVRLVNYDLGTALMKKSAGKLNNYDVVISYGEGIATQYCQHITAPQKLAWIHFDYARFPLSLNEESLYSQYNRIIFVSKASEASFQKRYPRLAYKTAVIYNLFDPYRISQLSECGISESFDNSILNIVSIGRVTPVKRYSKIPEIARELKDKGVSFFWRIIGPEADNNEAELLKQNIINNKVQDCVSWIGNRPNPYPYLKNSDLYVCISESEACPMVFNEAKVLGVYILSTKFPSAIEFIDNGEGEIVEINEMTVAIQNRKKVLNDKNYVLIDKYIETNNREIQKLKGLL